MNPEALPTDDELLERMAIEAERSIYGATPEERLAAWIVYMKLHSFLSPRRAMDLDS